MAREAAIKQHLMKQFVEQKARTARLQAEIEAKFDEVDELVRRIEAARSKRK